MITAYKKHIKRAMDVWKHSDYADNFLPGQKASHVQYYCKKMLEGREKYRWAASSFDMPWEIVGVLHGLEAQFNFERQILNGEKWQFRTTIVPEEKGPWESWSSSTKYALGHNKVLMPKNWLDFADVAHFFESWNGMGYYHHDLYSPYLWSYLAPYAKQGGGKYVADGEFDPKAISKQVGAMTLLIELGFFW